MYHFKNYIPARKKNGEWLSNQAIVIYALINMHTYGHSGLPFYNISIDCIGMELYDVDTLTTRQRQNVKDGFKMLMECFPDAITPVNEKKTVWKVDVDRFSNIDDDYQYAYCYNEDFMNVLHIQDSRTYSLAGFYVKFLSTFDYRYSVGRLSLDYIAKIMEVSITTIKTHIDKIKKVGAIKTYRGTTKKCSKGEYMSHPNIYYRPYEEKLATDYTENDMIHYFRNSQSP